MNKSEPAFPSHGSMGEVCYEGMTLRDYFAAKAMQALSVDLYFGTVSKPENPWAWVATESYKAADAMLIERAKEPTP